jgi:hypothetical protein
MTNEQRRRELAKSLGMLTAEDVELLAGIKASTRQAWSKRGKGPPSIRFGTAVLYPIESTAKHLRELLDDRPKAISAKDVL